MGLTTTLQYDNQNEEIRTTLLHVTTVFTTPAIGATVNVVVLEDTANVPAGVQAYIATAGVYTVAAIVNSHTLSLRNTGASGNATAGTSILDNTMIVVGGGGSGTLIRANAATLGADATGVTHFDFTNVVDTTNSFGWAIHTTGAGTVGELKIAKTVPVAGTVRLTVTAMDATGAAVADTSAILIFLATPVTS